MASKDYQKSKNTALRLVQKFGQEYILTLSGSKIGQFNHITQKKEVVADTQIAGYGVVTNWEKDEVDGTTIIFGDRKMIFVSDSVPVIGMTLNYQGTEYEIIAPLLKEQPRELVVFYTFNMRS